MSLTSVTSSHSSQGFFLSSWTLSWDVLPSFWMSPPTQVTPPPFFYLAFLFVSHSIFHFVVNCYLCFDHWALSSMRLGLFCAAYHSARWTQASCAACRRSLVNICWINEFVEVMYSPENRWVLKVDCKDLQCGKQIQPSFIENSASVSTTIVSGIVQRKEG